MGICFAKAEEATGMDLDGDGQVAGQRAAPSGNGYSARAGNDEYYQPGDEMDDGEDIPLSTCDGNKRSLFIGINYTGHEQGVLRGCINDVDNIKEFVTKNFDFPTNSHNMRTLVDDNTGDGFPDRATIIEGMKWLVEGAQSGDSLFIHYSGHGSHQKDVDPENDEADGQDETLVPYDYQRSGMITDDEIHAILVAPLPKGVRLTAIMDCCHSGSIFDLPFSYGVTEQGEVTEVDNRKLIMDCIKLVVSGNMQGAMALGMSAVKAKGLAAFMPGAGGAGAQQPQRAGGDNPEENSRATKIRKSLADVIQFSGCRDSQTSADASIGGEATGACSWAIIQAFKQHGFDQDYVTFLQNVRDLLHGKYTQVPQMSTGHKMAMRDHIFKM